MRIYYINPDGKRFDLWGDIQVTQVSGINPSCAISMEENAFGDGADYISERINSRNILLTLYPCCNYDEARLRLGKIFYGNDEGTLGFIYDNGSERSIDCRFESMTAVLTARPGTIQVSLLCGDPYFTANTDIVLVCGEVNLWEFDDWELSQNNDFEFGSISNRPSALVTNGGEVDSGCVIQIEVLSSVSGINILKAQTKEHIALKGTFPGGDIITIDTRPRRKKITLSNKYAGKETDITSRLLWGSTFFSIPRGKCRVSVRSDNGIDRLNVNLQFDERYRGV